MWNSVKYHTRRLICIGRSRLIAFPTQRSLWKSSLSHWLLRERKRERGGRARERERVIERKRESEREWERQRDRERERKRER